MTVQYLKKAAKTASDDASDVAATVREILDEIEAGGEEAARKYATKFRP
jgi:sulfopropanediol 3-dehydrogenase